MRAFKWFVVLIVVAWAGSPLTVTPRAQGPIAAFHAIGDLPGGGFTTWIKDATRSGGVIHAVGGAVARVTCPTGAPCASTDTGILWRSDGSALRVLPDVVSTSFNPPVTASAITPDGAYIASTARDLNTSTTPASSILRAVRVETNSLTNLNLSAFSPPLTISAGAVAISTSGSILYGRRSGRGIRFDTSDSTNVLIPLVCPGVNLQCPGTADNFNPVAERGSSADGSVAVGSSFNTTTSNQRHKAYRYVHDSGVTAIPLLPGGSFNDALAVSPAGDLVLVTGNSAENPNGEAYLYSASTGEIQRLGSPNAAWRPGPRATIPGGMTADGSVIAMTFSGNDGQYAYFRNSHGWFHLTSALGANGVDIAADGWNLETLQIQGMSSDGTLVFGSGEHNGNTDGFVAEFAPGTLASFNPQATPPVSTAVVGVWTFVDAGDPAPTDPDHVVVFTADGVYYHIEGEPGEPLAGFERGLYTFNGSEVAITTLFDTNGSTGMSSDSGVTYQGVIVSGDTLIVDGQVQAHRISGSPGSIVGGWVGGNPTEAHNSFLLAFAQNKYFAVIDFSDGSQSEVGTYTWNPLSHELIATVGGVVDTGNFVTPSADGLGLHVLGDDGDEFDLARIIDPATIPAITNPQLSASGVAGQAFNYGVTATNVATFDATGLPDGLSINSSTGQISGTPAIGGQFAVTISATSAR